MPQSESERAGRYIRQTGGFAAFIPNPLPPVPPIAFNAVLLTRLSEADRELARLDAVTEFLPNPDLFVSMYVRKEAVLSSQIEGTQASMADLLELEAGRSVPVPDVTEVVNYVRAMKLGLERLSELPLSLRLIKEIHAEILKGVRGSERSPGEFRRFQNWIGPPGCTLSDAFFVPPPPDEVPTAMGKLEMFFHNDAPMPILIRAALAHAQFETIHPFGDGNGRLGRLLITFLLCWKHVLKEPTLYLSHYFKRRRDEYYDRLQRVRDKGDFEGWVGFFLEGVREVSREGTQTARQILRLREEHRELVSRELPGSTAGLTLLDHLFRHPMINVNQAAEVVGRTYPIANQLIADMERLGLLHESTGQVRNRVFRYEPYLQIFGDMKP